MLTPQPDLAFEEEKRNYKNSSVNVDGGYLTMLRQDPFGNPSQRHLLRGFTTSRFTSKPRSA
jgi:hypothetical protein